MGSFYIPFAGKKPKIFDINGHKVLFVGSTPDEFEDLPLLDLGADRLKEVRVGESEEEQLLLTAQIAKKAKADIVVSPREVDAELAFETLKAQLPWVI